jgi:cytochrome c peroxidase
MQYRLASSKHQVLQKELKVVALVFIIMVGASAWTYNESLIPTGGYQLIYPANFGNRINTPIDNPTTKEGVFLGRMLFYEPRLSLNNTISCSSCHEQNKAFTDGRRFSIGVRHTLTDRNSMSLGNVLWTRKLFWDGRSTSLEEQAGIPMTNPVEMGQPLAVSAKKLSADRLYKSLFKTVYGDANITGVRIVKAIAQFERTLISANSKYDQYLWNCYKPTADEMAGMILFNQSPNPENGVRGANCARCHGGVKNYMELFHNNGLDSIGKDNGIEKLTGFSSDRGRFKVPTLRNIALTGPYMHDGRFKTLSEVLEHYSEHVFQSPSLSSVLRKESNVIGGTSLKLFDTEKKQIIAYLNMLTDSTFVTDPRFSNPHQIIAKTYKSHFK